MPAYIVVEIDIHNHEAYDGYKLLTPASIAAYDGKFIIRGGKTELLEGKDEPKRIVVIEFPSAERARQWWNSEEYAPAKKIRQENATTRLFLVEGVQAVQ
jgi:uncharacterized protein (DUF1330 family)